MGTGNVPIKGHITCVILPRIMKLVHWPLMGGLLHLVQRGGHLAGPRPLLDVPNVTAHLSTATVPTTVGYTETCVTRHILLLFLDDHLKHFFSQSTSVHSASEAFATMRYIN